MFYKIKEHPKFDVDQAICWLLEHNGIVAINDDETIWISASFGRSKSGNGHRYFVETRGEDGMLKTLCSVRAHTIAEAIEKASAKLVNTTN